MIIYCRLIIDLLFWAIVIKNEMELTA